MATTVLEFLQARVDANLKEALELNTQAEKAARSNTPDEKAHIERLLDEVTRHKHEIAEIEANESLRKAIEDMRGPVTQSIEEAPAGAHSIGEAFVKSESFQRSKAAGFSGQWTTGAVELPDGIKATVTEAASAIGTVDVRPGITRIPNWPLRVADLIPQGTTGGTSVSYPLETTATNAAAATTEGDPKPESTLIFTMQTDPVQKIATFLPVSDEMLEDVPALQSYLDARLSLFVGQAEETELLSGNGTPPHIKGIMARSGIQTGSALSLDVDSSIDAIFRAMTAVRVTGLYEPDGIVVHPTDWAGIRLMKDTAKQYYGGGPFTGAYGNGGGLAPDNLWGLPVVVTTSIAQGTVLVGAFKSAAFIFRKRGLTVEASNSHSDFFQKNLTAIRAEERLALAVSRESAFYKLTGVDQLLGS